MQLCTHGPGHVIIIFDKKQENHTLCLVLRDYKLHNPFVLSRADRGGKVVPILNPEAIFVTREIIKLLKMFPKLSKVKPYKFPCTGHVIQIYQPYLFDHIR